MLEVISSDFSKGLADMTSEEEASQREYESETKQNAITKAEKQQDVKHKTREHLLQAVHAIDEKQVIHKTPPVNQSSTSYAKLKH